MNIATLWITRKSDPEYPPELIVAWDEYCIDGNWEGWRDDCERSLASIGDDLDEKRFINIHVPDERITRFFKTPGIEATALSELDDPRAI